MTFARPVRVGKLRDLQPMLARDISAGGMFIAGSEAKIGDEVIVEFEADELPGVRFRARALVVHRVEGPNGGVGAQFNGFEEGGTELVRLIKFLLDPPRESTQ